MSTTKLRGLLGFRDHTAEEPRQDNLLEKSILQEEQQAQFELDKILVFDDDGTAEKRVQKEAQKEVQTAALDSLKRMHVIQMGRCPSCGEHLHQHLFASICEACGWHTYDAPRSGPVRVHLSGGKTIEGERCYVVKTGAVLVLNNDLVVAKVPKESLSWVEYVWAEDDVEQRHKQVVERMSLRCGWCSGEAKAESDGFHLVQIAFGTSQERYVFCSDKCYEAFRKMYPSRVHRNCYERNCAECNLCVKRYEDEEEGMRMLAKDFLKIRKK